MASIPLDLQKRCEQRWAARFSRPDPTAPKKVGPESHQQQTEPDKGKRKIQRVKLAGIRSAPAVKKVGNSRKKVERRLRHE
jgi:hypothetical protein